MKKVSYVRNYLGESRVVTYYDGTNYSMTENTYCEKFLWRGSKMIACYFPRCGWRLIKEVMGTAPEPISRETIHKAYLRSSYRKNKYRK